MKFAASFTSLVLAFVFGAGPVFGAPSVDMLHGMFPFEIEPGRRLYLQMQKPKNPSKPTFMLLPGINRSVFLEEAHAQKLLEMGYGVVTFNFSAHPLSSSLLEDGVKPYFVDHDYKLTDLAFEVEALAIELRRQGLKNLIPVTLSYTGIIAPLLVSFPLVINMSPMTSMAASQPMLDNFRKSLDFNFFLTRDMKRSMIDSSYRTYWSTLVQGYIQEFKIPKAREGNMIEGLVEMSRAAEDAEWFKTLPAPTSRQVFILAGQEDASLLKHQVQTAATYSKPTPTQVYVFEGAPHLIWEVEAEGLAQALDRIARGVDAPGLIVNKADEFRRMDDAKTCYEYLRTLPK